MKLTATLIFILFSSTLMFGQIIDRTENRAKQKTNQRVDNRVDQGLDKGLDAIEGIFKKKDKKKDKSDDNSANENEAKESSNAISRMFGGEVDIKDSYNFDHNVLLGIQTFDKKGKENEETETRMYFSESESNFGMDVTTSEAESFVIYDMETYQMVTLIDNDGQKMGMAIQLDPKDFDKEDDQADNAKYTFVKTGKSKVISGYNCDEYKMETTESNPETDNTYWITNDINANWMRTFANAISSNKNMAKRVELPKGYPSGSMIQVISESRKNQEKSITTVKEYKKNDRVTISTEGYQLMSIGGGK